MSNGAEPRSRGKLLTTLLIVFGLLTAIATISNLAMSGQIARNAPGWTQEGVLLLGMFGVPALIGLWGVWSLRKWGVVLYAIAVVCFFAVNMLVIGGWLPFVGLAGGVLIFAAVGARWRHFR